MSRERIFPNPENASAADLDTAAGCSVSETAKRQLQAMKSLILGGTFEFTCALFNFSERSLRRYIAAFNEQGIDGLIDRRHPGRPKAIVEEQAEYFEKVIEDPSLVDATHWTAKKFHGWLSENTEVEVSYRTVVRFFHERDFRLKVPQPWPDRQDEELRKKFREKLSLLLAEEDVELWFQDETGIEGDPRIRRRWAKKGSKPRVTKNGDHMRMNVCGMICPRTGEAFLLEFHHSNTEVFQAFLDEANKDLALERKRQIIVLDNASWHKSKSLNWGRFEPLSLPPYSPDLNPIERLDKALCWVLNRKTLNQQTCAIRP